MTSHQQLMGYLVCRGLLIIRRFYFSLVVNSCFVGGSFGGFFNGVESILNLYQRLPGWSLV
jgi:hypothetical protein